jgi:GDP-4-dehydro-6-deoxy-D-mannose reductase
MKVLVTGHSGFVGKNLLRVVASGRRPDVVPVTLPETFDLRSADAVHQMLAAIEFDHVIHLAAQSNVPASFSDPLSTFDINVLGTIRLLEALQARKFTGRLLYVSSGDVYGVVQGRELPVLESTPVRPANPYAASKVAAEAVVLSWGRRGGFETLVVRPFNHLGPGQATSFAIARFADALVRMKLGLQPATMTTGRLDVTRDFLDVRDVISAYFALLSSGRGGETYNVCSGIERRLDDVLQQLISLAGLQVQLSQGPALMRPADLPRMVGDANKLRLETGWSPIIPFSDTLQGVLSHFIQLHRIP